MKESRLTDFVNVHNRTEYSLLDSIVSIRDMVVKAKSLGMKHLAITDYGNMFGAVQFYNECKENNINPVIGCELPVKSSTGDKEDEGDRLILLAKNYDGYRNLMKLSSLYSLGRDNPQGEINSTLLKEYSFGLICISSCLNGYISRKLLDKSFEKAVKRAEYYRGIFGKGSYYLEIQDRCLRDHKIIAGRSVELSKVTGIPLVATNEIHYVEMKDVDLYETFTSMDDDRKRKVFIPDAYMKSKEEMFEVFKDIPEAIENTVKIAERCKLRLEFPGVQIPAFPLPEGINDPDKYLESITYKGLGERYSRISEEIKRRIDYELKVIADAHYADYFLIVHDYVHFARVNDIPVGPGRGFSAGSLVAYSLKITDIDPLEYGLAFECFLNPENISLPIFSIDFGNERYNEVSNYIFNKYGSDRVCRIITFGRKKYNNTRGPVSHAAVHPTGIVIGKGKLTDYVPLYKDIKTGRVTTQYTEDLLGPCGLARVYILGLTELTMMKEAEKLIKDKNPDFSIERIPLDDRKTLSLFAQGKTLGIYMFQNDGMREILKQVKPDSIEDLIALSSLYRQGLRQYIPQIIDGKKGNVSYPDLSMVDSLKSTYGVIVYREQIVEFISLVSGLTLARSEIIRRDMAKGKDLPHLEKDFVQEAVKNGLDEKRAHNIFTILKERSLRAYWKAYGVPSTLLAYRMAYLKANYPSEFSLVTGCQEDGR